MEIKLESYEVEEALKEFKLERRTVLVEECYVMAKDWEDAEEMGYMEEQDWEFSYDEAEIYSEEIESG
tara:strand:+ start:66 stop:269 length:204 start_codon:yes stop_codon:yes gene_type:complete